MASTTTESERIISQHVKQTIGLEVPRSGILLRSILPRPFAPNSYPGLLAADLEFYRTTMGPSRRLATALSAMRDYGVLVEAAAEEIMLAAVVRGIVNNDDDLKGMLAIPILHREVRAWGIITTYQQRKIVDGEEADAYWNNGSPVLGHSINIGLRLSGSEYDASHTVARHFPDAVNPPYAWETAETSALTVGDEFEIVKSVFKLQH